MFMDRRFDSMIERLTIQKFLEEKGLWKNCSISYPAQPDGVVKMLCGKTIWIEETSACRKPKYNPKKCPERDGDGWQRYCEYEFSGSADDCRLEIIKKIKTRICDKKNKKSYEKTANQYGKGFLLIRPDDPFVYYPKVLDGVKSQNNYKEISNLGFFHAVYIYIDTIRIIGEQNQPKFFLLCGQDISLVI